MRPTQLQGQAHKLAQPRSALACDVPGALRCPAHAHADTQQRRAQRSVAPQAARHPPLPRRAAAAPQHPTPPAAPHARGYRTPLPRSTLLAKVTIPGADHDATLPYLARTVPGAIAGALARVRARCPAASRAEPLAHLGLPGCYMGVTQLGVWPEGAEGADALHAFHAALGELLPQGVELVSVANTPMPASASGTLGARAEPVVLPLPDGGGAAVAAAAAAAAAAAPLTVHVPPELLARACDRGGGLRVVLAAATSQHAAVDMTLRPGDAAWPADGRLEVCLPDAGAAAPLAVVTLLRAAPPPAPGAEPSPDAFLTALPLLVLPEAAAGEVAALWEAMAALARQELPAGGGEEAALAATYAADFVPFAQDLGTLLRFGPEGLFEEMHSCVAEFLAANAMGDCLRLLADAAEGAPRQAPPLPLPAAHGAGKQDNKLAARRCSAAGTPPARVHSPSSTAGPSKPRDAPSQPPLPADGAAPLPSRLTRLGEARQLLFGFPSPWEGQYQRWKAARCRAHDRRAFTAAAIISAVPLAVVAAHGASWPTLTGLALQAGAAALPLAALVWRPAVHASARAALLCAVAIAMAALVALMMLLQPAAEVQLLVGPFKRPRMFIGVAAVLFPWLHQLSAWQQAISSTAQTFHMHLIYTRCIGCAYMPGYAYLAVPACGMAVAVACDARLRREWRACAAATASTHAAALSHGLSSCGAAAAIA